MADHAKPILTDNYIDVLSQIRGRFEDQAKGFDPANTSATNITTGTIRWNSAEKKFQKWSGTAWGDLTDNYVLSSATFSTGTVNGVAYLNGSKVLTTGSALTFDGNNLAVPTGSVTLGASTSGKALVVLNGDVVNAQQIQIKMLGTNALIDATRFSGTQPQMLFAIDGSEQMRLTSTGLGIGTSSPTTKLEVVGTGRFNSMEIGANNSDINNANLNPIAFKIQGTERMRLDASGNLGLGVVPSAWNQVFKPMQLGIGASIWGRDSIAQTGIGNNVYWSGGDKYIFNGVASKYVQEGNTHQWFTAPSGTAGSTISFTQSMTLDANGKLILSAANQGIQFADGTTQTTAAPNLATMAVGAVGTYAMLKFIGSGSVLDGSTVSGTNLRYTNAAGTTTDSGGFPTGTWKAMGFVQTTSDATRTTLWLRIS